MSRGARVALNSVWLFASEGLRRAIAFVVIFLVGRSLAVDDFGRFRLAQSFFVIALVAATFGLTPLITKRIAAGERDESRFLGNVYGLKILLALIVLGIATLLASLMGYDRPTFLAIVVMALAIPAESLASTHFALYDGRQAMQLNGIVDFARGLVLLALIAAAVFLHWGLIGILAAYVAHYAFGAILAHALSSARVVRFGFRFEWSEWKAILQQALPFVAIGIVWVVTFRIDMVLLSLMRNETAVGYYGAAYSIFEILLVLPNVLTRALFPALAGSSSEGGDGELMRKAVRVFALVALPVGVGIALTATSAVTLVFGEKYAPGGRALAVMGGPLALWFCTMGFSWALTARNQIRYVLRANLVALGVRVVANLILIPRYDYLGAAIAAVISESAYFAVIIGPVHREVLRIDRSLVHPGTIAATVLMAGCVMGLGNRPLWIVVPAGMVVFAAVGWASGALREPFIVSAWSGLRARMARS
ncbi:MAG: flippase [Deltaproteobacteria bacterium]|nr:flippase [Deltaproteobacteria bacterium]